MLKSCQVEIIVAPHLPITRPDLAMSMPRRVVCGAVAARPADEVHAEMADACRQGRAVVAACIPKPITGAPSSCRLERRPPQPASPPAYPAQAGDDQAIKADERRAAAARRVVADEEEARAAVARFRPFVRVAAVSATTPNSDGEDPYSLEPHRRWSRGWNV